MKVKKTNTLALSCVIGAALFHSQARAMMGGGGGGGCMMGGGMGMGMATINGISFSETDAYTISSMLATYEIWEVYNNCMMDHPFHQHVNHAQVISISGGDSAYKSLYTSTPALKDTVIVPRMGSIKLLVSIMDYTGMTMFHCHILEHEDMGMMGVWEIQ